MWPFASSFKCKFAKSPQQAARISLLLTHTSLHAAACGRGARLPARSALSNWRGHICMQQCAAVSIDALSSMELRQLSQPIIIQGAAENWAALERWQREKIIELYGNEVFFAHRSGRDLTIRKALGSCGRYYFGRNFWPRHGQCYSDRYRQFSPFLLDAAANDFSIAAKLQPLYVLQMGLGCGAGNGVAPERHGTAWFTSVRGRKRWVMWPPELSITPDPAMPPSGECKVRLPNTSSGHSPSPLVCDVNEGETMWVPAQWWHETCSLDDFTVGVGGLIHDSNATDLPTMRGALDDGWRATDRPPCGDEEKGGRITEYDVDDIPHCQRKGCSTLYHPRHVTSTDRSVEIVVDGFSGQQSVHSSTMHEAT